MAPRTKFAAMTAGGRPTLETDEATGMKSPLMSLRGVSAGYGAARVLHGLDLDIFPGETLVVMGRNGVGKTTLVETIIGLTSHHAGEISFNGRAIHRLAAHQRNRVGIAWVPQQREV